MKLIRISVQNYRSFGERTELALSGGMNALVGPNNCGKSNFLSSVGMALDPHYEFDRRHDVFGQGRAFPRTTLTFQCDRTIPAEKTLLQQAEAYERSVSGSTRGTYAEHSVVRFVATYRLAQNTATRQEYFAARGVGDLRGDPELNEKAVRQFRKIVRFVAVDSGQSVSSLLGGKFREILHAVVKGHLRQEFADAEAHREQYIAGLQSQLLAPVREMVLQVTGRLFPEISEVGLTPLVSGIDETLSNIDISVRDSVDSALGHKGTGVSGGVLVALLRYLANSSRQSLVLAVEEPETFLHPAAQEVLRDDLEALAERDDVTLLVASHSPYVLSRVEKAQVVEITKRDGVSRIGVQASGTDHLSSAIRTLFRDSAIPDLLQRHAEIPRSAEAILLVEGTTDYAFLAIAARILGCEATLAKIHVVPAGGTYNLQAQAVLLRAEATQPIWVLLDSDQAGRQARDALIKRFQFRREDILHYGQFLNGLQDTESEWLFPAELMQRFVDAQGQETVLKSMQKIKEVFRYDLTPRGKEMFPPWLSENALPEEMKDWQPVLDLLAEKLCGAGTAAALSDLG